MIGIFDSGSGGLSVVREFLKQLPDYELIYFGDIAHLPYGTKSPALIKKLSKEIVNFLLKKGAKVIIIACHTSSVLTSDFLKKQFPKLPIFEIITPGIKEAIKITKNKKIGVIGSPATIKSKSHENKLLFLEKNLKVYSKACPLFVPLVEEAWIDHKQTKEIAKEYLLPLKKEGIDVLILACTHYPLLKKTISEIMGKKVKIIDPAKNLVSEFKNFLKRNKRIEKKLKKGSRHRFFFSDYPYNFETLSNLCFLKDVPFKVVNQSMIDFSYQD